MNTEHTNTSRKPSIPEEAWDVFLPEDEEPQPDEGDFWFEMFDFEDE